MLTCDTMISFGNVDQARIGVSKVRFIKYKNLFEELNLTFHLVFIEVTDKVVIIFQMNC